MGLVRLRTVTPAERGDRLDDGPSPEGAGGEEESKMMGLELLILVGVVAAVIWGAQQGWSGFRRGETRETSSALDILERRYAQGEIDQDEFQDRRATLVIGGTNRPTAT
jgi:hypothetical protein